jgi:hypothetical protein
VVRAHADPRDDLDLFPLGRPEVPTGLRGLAARLSAWSRFTGMARRYRATVREFADAAVSERLEDDFATRPDAELAVRARLLHDRLAEGWTLSQLGVLVAHVAGRPLRRRAKADVAALGRGTNIAHEPTFPVVLGLAELLRADEELRALAEWGDPDAVRQKSPEFGAAFDEALTRIGHRGPNEAELSGSPFAERPELVFAAALRASRRPVRAEAAPTAEQPTTPADEPPTWPADDGPSTDDPPAESSTSDQSAVDSAATPPRRKRKFAEKLAIAGQRHRELAIDARFATPASCVGSSGNGVAVRCTRGGWWTSTTRSS